MLKSGTSGLLVTGGGVAVTVMVAGFVSVKRSTRVLGLLAVKIVLT